MNAESIGFPHLSILFRHVGQNLSIGSIEIAFYGIIIALGMLSGIYLAMYLAKKTGQDPDIYFDFSLIAIVLSVMGARAYYVIFSWDYYKAHPLEILNLRGGGLAIYGGVLTGIAAALIYVRVKKLKMGLFLDTAVAGLIIGQVIGRWGNFFNREAFGKYTDSFFCMQLPLDAVKASDVTEEMLAHAVSIDGISVIQVHPTFLYESVWNLILLGVIVCLTLKGKKRWDGAMFLLYLLGYGIGRCWIEGLRTDQLLWPGSHIAVSQVLSGMLVLTAAALWICLERRHKKEQLQGNVTMK